MSDSDITQTVLGLAIFAGFVLVLIRPGKLTKICMTWCTVQMIGRAIVCVPLGLVLLVIAYIIVMNLGGNWLWLLFAGYLGWLGCNYIFESLMGLTGAPTGDAPGRATTASHASLRRRGLFGRR